MGDETLPLVTREQLRVVESDWQRQHPSKLYGMGHYYRRLPIAGDGVCRSWLRHVGLTDDGRLINPHGYPEQVVRDAIAKNRALRIEKRFDAALKATDVRTRRRKLRIERLANDIAAGKALGPSANCVSCRSALRDQIAIARGVGPGCLELAMRVIETRRVKAAPRIERSMSGSARP